MRRVLNSLLSDLYVHSGHIEHATWGTQAYFLISPESYQLKSNEETCTFDIPLGIPHIAESRYLYWCNAAQRYPQSRPFVVDIFRRSVVDIYSMLQLYKECISSFYLNGNKCFSVFLLYIQRSLEESLEG